MRAVVMAIVLVSGLSCGTEADELDCLVNGNDTICFDGLPEDTVSCDQIGGDTFVCGAQEVTTNFGAPDSEAARSEATLIWKPRRRDIPEAVDRRLCDRAAHVCIVCATCSNSLRSCVECATEGRVLRGEPVEASPDIDRAD